MNSLEKIKEPVSNELQEFEKYFSSYMKSNVALLNIITNYVLKRKGKQMRPILVLLTAKMLGGISKSTFYAASLIELMHTATLIHDDVVDESYQRRNFWSVNALWRNKISVLVGDYLLSKGLLLSIEHSEFEFLRTVSEAVKEMSEGELLQIEKARNLDISEELYFSIIKKKTAALISACSVSGAQSAKASPDDVNNMKVFGESLGIAFQIKDDIFDYNPENKTGKPYGNDLREKKITLPLLYALNKSEKHEKKQILKYVASGNILNSQIAIVNDFVRKYKGFDYASAKMDEYRQRATDVLSTMPENEARKSLFDFVEFVTNRKS